jgi:hypothetical protein
MTNPEPPGTAPVAWCRSDDFRDALQKVQSFNGWRVRYPDCDMALYAQPQASAAQSTGPSLKEVGTLVSWLTDEAINAADDDLPKTAEMLTWAAQVVGERVDEDAPDADRAEGPSLDDVDELCAEFSFHCEDYDSLGVLRDMITAAITRWRAPVAEPVAKPVDGANLTRLVEGVDPLAPEDPDVDHILTLAGIVREVDGGNHLGAAALAEAILAHPDFSGCHDGPAALPAPDHLNLIGFAFGREPWATWLRQGGCLESAHCELSDLMLAVLARWGRPAAPPAPEVQGVAVDRYEFSVFDSDDQEMAGGDAATLSEAVAEGRHYLRQYNQDGPHKLELRRVLVLDLSEPALPVLDDRTPEEICGYGDDGLCGH